MRQETIYIETPEKIVFYYKIAQIGARVAAYVLDVVIQLAVIILVLLLISAVSGLGMTSLEPGGESQAFYLTVAFFYLLYFFFQWGYFALFELLRQGQSPGKRMLRIHVIRSDGEPLDAASILIRNLLRAVDGFPFLNILGGLVAMIDKKSRRFGDMVGDTLVVHEVRFDLKEPEFETRLSEQVVKGPGLELTRKLSEEELFVIRRFLQERYKIPKDRLREIASKLAGRVVQRLNIETSQVEKDPVLFLERVYKEHTVADEE